MSYTIGIDLGGSCVKAVAVTPDGKTLTKHNLPFDADADMEWANRLRELVQSIEKDQDGKPDNMGFSAPGLAAPDGSCITHMPVRLEGLVGLNWQKFFDFDKAISVLNDGHAALLGPGDAILLPNHGLHHTCMHSVFCVSDHTTYALSFAVRLDTEPPPPRSGG